MADSPNIINGYNINEPVKIPLDLILMANGYKLVHHKSSRNYPVLENDNGHKVVISHLPNGDYLYFNARDDDDKGNIYSLCRNNGTNIKDLLSTFLEKPIDKEYVDYHTNNHTKEQENEKIVNEYLNLHIYDTSTNNYLQRRAISKEIIESYNESIKTDKYNNVYFPQWKLETKQLNKTNEFKNIHIRGFTKRFNQPFLYNKSISHNSINNNKPIKSITQGQKGLEILLPNNIKQNKAVNAIIISESVIDSLSFCELTRQLHQNTNSITKKPISNLDNNAIIIGTSGNININEEIESTFSMIIEKFQVKEWHLCFDSDEAGTKLKDKFIALAQNLDIKTYICTSLTKDFNDDLRLFRLLSQDNAISHNIPFDIKDEGQSNTIYGMIPYYQTNNTENADNPYYNSANKVRANLHNKIDKKILDIIEDYKYTNSKTPNKTQKRKILLDRIRNIKKLYPQMNNETKQVFNNYKYKDARIRDL